MLAFKETSYVYQLRRLGAGMVLLGLLGALLGGVMVLRTPMPGFSVTGHVTHVGEDHMSGQVKVGTGSDNFEGTFAFPKELAVGDEVDVWQYQDDVTGWRSSLVGPDDWTKVLYAGLILLVGGGFFLAYHEKN